VARRTGFGGAGPTGFAGSRITSRPLGIVNPVGKIGKVNPSFNGGTRIGGGRIDGGRTGGDDHPRKPRVPRLPIIVGVPTAVTAAAPATSGSTTSQLKSSGGGQSSSGGSGRRIGNGLPPVDERRYVPDEVLIQMASTVRDDTIDALARRVRLNRVESFTTGGVTMFLWKILDQRSVPTVIRQLQAERIVLAVQPNFFYYVREQRPASDRPQTTDTEGDPAQYAIAKLRLPQAHTLAKGEKVLVAVIDSGVDASHPELEGMIAESFDAIGSGEKAHSHGTAVAGAIVAHARLLGVAPQARILAVRAFSLKNQTAEATTYRISKGIDWAISRGARVINMCFTGERDPLIEQRMAHAHRQGLVLDRRCRQRRTEVGAPLSGRLPERDRGDRHRRRRQAVHGAPTRVATSRLPPRASIFLLPAPEAVTK
jgi:hypothetical protein